MTNDPTFDRDSLARIEVLLHSHPITTSLFHGELFDRYLQPLADLRINRNDGTALLLNRAETARLFMIPDESIVATKKLSLQRLVEGPAMTTTSKHAPFDLAAYKLAAAKMREEYAKNIPPLHPDEILPVNGVISVVLSGKPFSPEFMEELNRRSRIDIPEFRIEREKMKKGG